MSVIAFHMSVIAFHMSVIAFHMSVIAFHMNAACNLPEKPSSAWLGRCR